MKAKYILKGLFATLLLVVLSAGCESYNEPLLTDIGNTSAFSPVDLKAIIRNQTTVELSWMTREEDDHYVVEFSADDPTFATIFKTVEVTAAELPIQVALEGETLYSIRVKAVGAKSIADSKWSVTTANTLSEQLFLPAQDGDIKSKEVILRWVAGSNVTKIVFTPGDITHTITAEEKASGIATITGLLPETAYQADLFNGTKKRGATAFETGIDIGTGILVTPTDDFVQMIADAPDGSVLVFEPGDYTSNIVTIELKKAITLRGLRSYDKPKLKVSISALAGATDISLIDLDLTGDVAQEKRDMFKFNEDANYGNILVSGCNIHDYEKSLISGSIKGKVESVTIENSVITNVITNGGDLIDFRNTYVASIVVKNSTFNNCAVGRDFFRADKASGFSGTGLTTLILVENCTMYKVATGAKRFLYVRFKDNSSTVRNTIFAETNAIYSNQSDTGAVIFGNNVYNNAEALITTNTVFDATGTVLNPQFADAATGDFTVGNQSVIDNKVGDPRWIK